MILQQMSSLEINAEFIMELVIRRTLGLQMPYTLINNHYQDNY